MTVGSTIEIQWHVSVPHNTLDWDLWYSTTGSDGPWNPIAMDLPPGDISDGAVHEFLWRVPAGLSGNLHIRVRQDNAGDDYDDVSVDAFTVAEAPAAYTPFGSGCPGSAGTFLVIGFTRTTTNLTSVGMPGCSSFLSLDLALPLATTHGLATWSFTIPNDLRLIGVLFYNQALVLDAGAGNPLGAVVTNAAEGRIGAR